MTIVESIKCVLQQNNDGLTSKQIYDEIIRQGLYSFGERILLVLSMLNFAVGVSVWIFRLLTR